MRSISVVTALLVTLLAGTTRGQTTQLSANWTAGTAPADSSTYHGLELLEPGTPVRARYADYGDSLRLTTELTGTFRNFEVGEAFEMEVPAPTGARIHQVAIEDLITIEVGTVKRATTRGSLYGLLGGSALGVVGSAIASNETSGDADYWSGATIGGFVGAGIGALLGHQTTEVEWERLPLYGPAYDDPPADHD